VNNEDHVINQERVGRWCQEKETLQTFCNKHVWGKYKKQRERWLKIVRLWIYGGIKIPICIYVEPSQGMSCGTTIIWEDEPAKVKFKVDGDKFKVDRELVFFFFVFFSLVLVSSLVGRMWLEVEFKWVV